MIAAVDENWGIGFQNQLLFHFREDMKLFRKRTLGNVIIMGRKTLESFPGGKPLPDRMNIVLSHSDHISKSYDNLVWVKSVDEALNIASKENKEIFVAGGEQIYREFMPRISKAFITKVHDKKKADAFLNNFDLSNQWNSNVLSKQVEEGTEIEFVLYEKKEDVVQ